MNEFTFKQTRFFSEIFQASVDFLRQEWRFFLKMIAFYAGPFILITAGLNVFFQQSLQEAVMNPDFFSNPVSVFSGNFFLLLLAGLISNTMLYAAVYAYIVLYAEKGSGNFSQDEVWQKIRDSFLLVLISSIVVGFLTILGTLLFIIPGIYIAVPLAMIFISRMYENISLGDGIRRVFNLIRGHWWQTFGLILVSAILVFFIQLLVSLPQTIYSGIRGFHQMSGGQPGGNDMIYQMLNIITIFLTTIAGAYTLLIIALQYFSLREEKDQPDLNQRVQELYGNQSEGEGPTV